MAEDLLILIEKQKDLLDPETYKRIKENYNDMPDELKSEILTQLQDAVFLKEAIGEYENKRAQAIDEASAQLKDIKSGYLKTYKEAVAQIETQDKSNDSQNMDDELANL